MRTDLGAIKKHLTRCEMLDISGVGGIRTHAGLTTPNGFRVRPLQPGLGTTPC